MRMLIVAMMTLIISSQSWAIDQNRIYKVLGYGDESCGTWLESRSEKGNKYLELAMNGWVLGYLSGFNLQVPGKADWTNGVDNNGLFKWIDNYCSQNPLKSLSDAVETLFVQLSTK